MKLKDIYREVIKKGIEADVRGSREIEAMLTKHKEDYDKLSKEEKEHFDKDLLSNPFADSRILYGNPESNIKSVIVGIDVDGAELLLADRLRQNGEKIDLVIAHHPQGCAYARFYDVMDLQVDIFVKEGISMSVSENLLRERKAQVARRISAANHSRSVDIAKLLHINYLCMHTPCDNLVYQHLRKVIDKNEPKNLGRVIDILQAIPEYKEAARSNNPPQITIGSKASRCKNIHIEFTGGTEGPKDIYEKLASKGIDTIIAMHQSEEHYKKCKECNINVIVASHIASDNVGVNIMLDHLERKDKLKVYEFSGFRRFKRKAK